MRIDLCRRDDSEGRWSDRSGHLSVQTRMPVLKEEKDTQGINSGGSPNDNMASDFNTCLHYVWFANTFITKYVFRV